jgi:predicted transcriptional regulator
MTQKEIAEKCGVPQCDVSIAIKYVKHIEPIGKREVVSQSGRNISVNEYEADSVASALVTLYLSRSNKHLEKAREWSDKAEKIIQIRRINSIK